MRAQVEATPYPGVNAALAWFLAEIQEVLGAHFVGMYLVGSLALGDFDPDASDLDLIVVTDDRLPEDVLAALGEMHSRLLDDGTPWAAKTEMVYVDRQALRSPLLTTTAYPQVETERGWFVEPLEDGWLAQCHTLREVGVTVAGPEPRTLVGPVDPDAMRRTVAKIPEKWQREAHNDPTWREWLRWRRNQVFVTLTLCRLLYTLATGDVASKPVAARWAQTYLGEPWAALIARTLAAKREHAVVPEADFQATVALVDLAVARFRAWETTPP